WSGQPYVVVYLSLTCRDCVRLLADIPDSLAHLNGRLSMYIEGTEEEVAEIVHYYTFAIPVRPISSTDRLMVHRIGLTPFAYYVDEQNKVVRSGAVHTKAEILELVNGNSSYGAAVSYGQD